MKIGRLELSWEDKTFIGINYNNKRNINYGVTFYPRPNLKKYSITRWGFFYTYFLPAWHNGRGKYFILRLYFMQLYRSY